MPEHHVGRKAHVTIWRNGATEDQDVLMAMATSSEVATEIVDHLNMRAIFADRIAQLESENASLRNQLGDSLCWVKPEDEAQPLIEDEFLESCRRYRQQLAEQRGEFRGGMTIAQLEAELARLRAERDAVVKALELIAAENQDEYVAKWGAEAAGVANESRRAQAQSLLQQLTSGDPKPRETT